MMFPIIPWEEERRLTEDDQWLTFKEFRVVYGRGDGMWKKAWTRSCQAIAKMTNLYHDQLEFLNSMQLYQQRLELTKTPWMPSSQDPWKVPLSTNCFSEAEQT